MNLLQELRMFRSALSLIFFLCFIPFSCLRREKDEEEGRTALMKKQTRIGRERSEKRGGFYGGLHTESEQESEREEGRERGGGLQGRERI